MNTEQAEHRKSSSVPSSESKLCNQASVHQLSGDNTVCTVSLKRTVQVEVNSGVSSVTYDLIRTLIKLNISKTLHERLTFSGQKQNNCLKKKLQCLFGDKPIKRNPTPDVFCDYCYC